MFPRRLLVPWLTLAVLASFGGLGTAAPAVKLHKLRPAILDERPCGPDSITGPLRFLFYQGCAGADFRDACRRHDACYDALGSDRKACDRQFLEEMLLECETAKYPWRARCGARIAFLGVRFGGKGAWKSAQELTRSLLAGGTHVKSHAK